MNGWLRLGVVLTIAWLPLGAFLGDMIAANFADQFAAGPRDRCLQIARLADSADSGACWAEYDRTKALLAPHRWRAMLTVSLVPIAPGWLLAYIGLLVARWIRGGFRKTA